MLDDKKLYSFQEAGFQVFRKDGKTKLVKGRCEVHLSAVEGSLMMAIPVVRIPAARPIAGKGYGVLD